MRLGYVIMSAYNFVRSGPNFTKFFCSTPRG